jgi:hypothetical protein
MAAKKKTRKKQTRANRAAGRKVAPAKKLSKKSAIPKRKSARKKAPQKKVTAKTKPAGKKKPVGQKKAIGARALRAPQKKVGKNRPTAEASPLPVDWPVSGSRGRSGDLQGLSSVEGADSESVDELLEEGNAFEADVVAGVEAAGNAPEKEVRTHEVPEDDVPGEYLEKE